jgi:hypothetical protein
MQEQDMKAHLVSALTDGSWSIIRHNFSVVRLIFGYMRMSVESYDADPLNSPMLLRLSCTPRGRDSLLCAFSFVPIEEAVGLAVNHDNHLTGNQD